MEVKEIFNNLEDEAIKHTGGPSVHVKESLDGSIKFLNLVSCVIELYIPQFLGTLSQLFNGPDTGKDIINDELDSE